MKLIILFTVTTALFAFCPNLVSALPGDPDNFPPAAIGIPSVSENISELNNAIGPNSKLNAFTSPGLIISSLLPYLFTIAGLILFAMLITGGFTMLTAATNPKKAEAGKQRITNAFVGFIIIFTAYWLTQILEIVLGISIL